MSMSFTDAEIVRNIRCVLEENTLTDADQLNVIRAMVRNLTASEILAEEELKSRLERGMMKWQ